MGEQVQTARGQGRVRGRGGGVRGGGGGGASLLTLGAEDEGGGKRGGSPGGDREGRGGVTARGEGGGSSKSFAGRLVFLPFPRCQRKLELAGNVREYLQVRSNEKFAEVVKSHAWRHALRAPRGLPGGWKLKPWQHARRSRPRQQASSFSLKQ